MKKIVYIGNKKIFGTAGSHPQFRHIEYRLDEYQFECVEKTGNIYYIIRCFFVLLTKYCKMLAFSKKTILGLNQ